MKTPTVKNAVETISNIKIDVPEKLKKLPFDKFKIFNERFTIIYDLLIRVILLFVLMTVFYFFLKKITSNKYVLTNVEVARSLEEGEDKIYSSDLKQKIIMNMKTMMKIAKNATHTSSNIAGAVASDAIPLNIGGFDLNQMFLHFRNFFNMQNKEISAYLMKIDKGKNKFKVLLKIGENEQTESDFANEENITEFLGEEILKYNDPHKIGLYYIVKQDTVKLQEIITRLTALDSSQSRWEKIFQDNNWKEKATHLEAMNLFRNERMEGALKKFKEIHNYKEYPEIVLEIAQINNRLDKGLDTTINVTKKLIKDQSGKYLDGKGEKELKEKSIKSTALMILADSYSRLKNYSESENYLNSAVNQLPEEDRKSNSAIYNWAANIQLRQLDILCSSKNGENREKNG